MYESEMYPAFSKGGPFLRLRKGGLKPLRVHSVQHLQGVVSLPGDKSIAHRSLIISAIAKGSTRIENFPRNQDCLATLKALQKLGIKIKQEPRAVGMVNSVTVNVRGGGLLGLSRPESSIWVGDSGTTLRLILGALAGQDFKVKLIAGPSLSVRPMLRVTRPLRMMGAKISSRRSPAWRTGRDKQIEPEEEYPPIIIKGGNLKPITYKMPIASAQVKSAILLAGLYAEGKTRIIEPVPSRDHTERLLKLFKAEIKVKRNTIVIKGNRELVSPKKIYIPGDISSAAFFITLAALIPHSEVVLRGISLNPSRIGIIRVLRRMGADIKVTRSTCLTLPVRQAGGRQARHHVTSIEPMGDIFIKSSSLKGVVVKKKEIPSLIDELPILMVAASYAKGKTIFEGVGELRVKETDRIRSMFDNLRKMGAVIRVLSATNRGGSAKNSGGKKGRSENVVIRGVKKLKGVKVKSFQDHRTAMSMIVAGLLAEGQTQIDDISCLNKSFPNFLSPLESLSLRH